MGLIDAPILTCIYWIKINTSKGIEQGLCWSSWVCWLYEEWGSLKLYHEKRETRCLVQFGSSYQSMLSFSLLFLSPAVYEN